MTGQERTAWLMNGWDRLAPILKAQCPDDPREGRRLMSTRNLFITLGFVFVSWTVPGISFSHNWQILNCSRNIVYTQAELLGIERQENGTVAEGFDTNNDGKVDVVAFSASTGAADPEGRDVSHKPVPIYYEVDTNYDGSPDRRFYMWGDKMEDCDGIREVLDFNDPKAPWEDPDRRGFGGVGIDPVSETERYSIQPIVNLTISRTFADAWYLALTLGERGVALWGPFPVQADCMAFEAEFRPAFVADGWAVQGCMKPDDPRFPQVARGEGT